MLIYTCAIIHHILMGVNNFSCGSGPPLPLLAISIAKSPVFLILNYGSFEGTSCDVRLLSHWIYDLIWYHGLYRWLFEKRDKSNFLSKLVGSGH